VAETKYEGGKLSGATGGKTRFSFGTACVKDGASTLISSEHLAFA